MKKKNWGESINYNKCIVIVWIICNHVSIWFSVFFSVKVALVSNIK